MTDTGPPDPHGLAELVDDLENRIAGDSHPPGAATSADEHGAHEVDGPVGEADLDLDDLTGAGARPEPAEPPA